MTAIDGDSDAVPAAVPTKSTSLAPAISGVDAGACEPIPYPPPVAVAAAQGVPLPHEEGPVMVYDV